MARAALVGGCVLVLACAPACGSYDHDYYCSLTSCADAAADGAFDAHAADRVDSADAPAESAGMDVAIDAVDAPGMDAPVAPDVRVQDVAGMDACSGALTACAGRCVNVATDATNCGTCGHACAAGQACAASMCMDLQPGPPNDHCAGATQIDLTDLSQTIVATTIDAHSDLEAPCAVQATGPDVFYRFTLTSPELVYADTVGAGFDTVLFFASTCAQPQAVSPIASGLLECNDDVGTVAQSGCTGGGTASQVLAYLGIGTHFLVLAGHGTATGAVSFQFTHVPSGNNGAPRTTVLPPAPILLPAGPSTLRGVAAGAGLISAASVGLDRCAIGPGGSGAASDSGPGPEQMYFWRTCPEFAGGAMTATTCNAATTWDDVVYLASPATMAIGECVDDLVDCAANSGAGGVPLVGEAAPMIPAGGGLHVLVVDSIDPTGGSFELDVMRP
jgi:hypothetical protein